MSSSHKESFQNPLRESFVDFSMKTPSKKIIALSVILAFILVVIIRNTGAYGVTYNRDFPQTTNPAVAIAQGKLSCAYDGSIINDANPLYPLILALSLRTFTSSQDISQLFEVDSTVCANPNPQISLSDNLASHIVSDTAFVTWLVVAFGLIYVLQKSARKNTWFLIYALFGLSLMPFFAASISIFFHPEDVLAIGLVLISTGAMLREKWILSGIFAGLALDSKLIAVPFLLVLFVLIPGKARIKFTLAAVFISALILSPFLITLPSSIKIFAGHDALTFLINAPSIMSYLKGIFGSHAALASRGLPVIFAGVFAIVFKMKLPNVFKNTEAVVILLCASAIWRVFFEVEVFAYYLMPISITFFLIVLICNRGYMLYLFWSFVTALIYNATNGAWGEQFMTKFFLLAQLIAIMPPLLFIITLAVSNWKTWKASIEIDNRQLQVT
ncbi:MAG: hypothetical protein HKL80_03815 [Acidimicrobiales bacterium]|nr:hypothetical protein [Acidimicrobiales bacterium]